MPATMNATGAAVARGSRSSSGRGVAVQLALLAVLPGSVLAHGITTATATTTSGVPSPSATTTGGVQLIPRSSLPPYPGCSGSRAVPTGRECRDHGEAPRSSFLVFPTNDTAMFIVGQGSLFVSTSSDGGSSWTSPLRRVGAPQGWEYPLAPSKKAGSVWEMYQAGEPRFTSVGAPGAHTYVAPVLEYPHGIGIVQAEWNGTGLAVSGNLSTLVWQGMDGGAIRHAFTHRKSGSIVVSVQENGLPCPTEQGEHCNESFPSKVGFVSSGPSSKFKKWTAGRTLHIDLPALCADQWCDHPNGTS